MVGDPRTGVCGIAHPVALERQYTAIGPSKRAAKRSNMDRLMEILILILHFPAMPRTATYTRVLAVMAILRIRTTLTGPVHFHIVDRLGAISSSGKVCAHRLTVQITFSSPSVKDTAPCSASTALIRRGALPLAAASGATTSSV